MEYTESVRRELVIENGEVTSIKKRSKLENILEMTVKDEQKHKHKFRYEHQIYPIDVHGRVSVRFIPSSNLYRIDRYGATIRKTVAYAELVDS